MVHSGAEEPVTVVGSGPYGLATAAHLKARKIPFRIFGEPMDGWRSHMPRGMYLKSSPFSSSISAPGPGRGLADFRASEGREFGGERDPVPISEFVRYGLWFQQHAVPELERVTVRHMEKVPGAGFRIALDSGEEFGSRAVVLAVGIVRFANVPSVLAHLVDDGLVSHTADHVDLSPFVGQRVAVVGAGQSALESAALLHEAGAQPTVVARAASVVFGPPPPDDQPAQRSLRVRLMYPNSLLGDGWPLVACSKGPAAYRHLPDRARAHFLRTILGPYGAWWLRDRVDGHFPVRCGFSIGSATHDSGSVRLQLRGPDGGSQALEADHVIAGTGYRVDLDKLELLSPELRREVVRIDGAPRLSADFESSVPGLFFTGLAAAPTFGPLLRFVSGAGFAAGRISTALGNRGAAPG
ncbi:NAD(P)-binding domain-containing protein [Streptomyces sp. NBC_00124]|uniref:NAD(P)-binding domain-containing protein n=1 Tax=Streptomyces sp. NBC_00124 TaxID=2975662 RepID=UPI00225A9242|nr:NAD(P)-binding domain-containing protein [Streptomyces sp. NBC_00124]MCX5357965.1 NAD(P)-binding domain-containing protein [Streptomyces sp. NBC_00124]